MILKGLPEFFSYNREMSRRNRPTVTWREFQRLKANGLGASRKPVANGIGVNAPKKALQAVPTKALLVYQPPQEPGCTATVEALAGYLGKEVVSDDYLEAEPLSLSPVIPAEE